MKRAVRNKKRKCQKTGQNDFKTVLTLFLTQ